MGGLFSWKSMTSSRIAESMGSVSRSRSARCIGGLDDDVDAVENDDDGAVVLTVWSNKSAGLVGRWISAVAPEDEVLDLALSAGCGVRNFLMTSLGSRSLGS